MSETADLGSVFDEHTGSSSPKTSSRRLRTMTGEPCVWHVPVVTGATGGEAVGDFHSSRFIEHTPDDAALRPISRTVSAQRVIDEFVLEFTHDTELPWMLPGVAPTGRRVRIPTVVVMGFDGDRVASEHICCDQASVLVQVGLLEPSGLPAAGAEQAARLLELAGAGARP